MVQVRFHGRGGQGAVIAANILGIAAFKEGKYCQSYGVFAGERRGAPVLAFTRIDDEKISLRCKIYEPDHVVVLDSTLPHFVDVTAGASQRAWIVLNSQQKPEELGLPQSFNIATVDASSIAVRHGLGSYQTPIVNTAILGAFSRITKIVGLDAIVEAIKEEVPIKEEENIAAALEAYELVTSLKRSDGRY